MMRESSFPSKIMMYVTMRFVGLLLGFLFLTCMAIVARAATPASKPRWYTHYNQAREIARRTGKPLFIVFR